MDIQRKEKRRKQYFCGKTGVRKVEILLFGALMVGLPIIIMGCVAAWREHQHNEKA